MWFKNLRQKYRIDHGQCPYCKAEFVLVELFDGNFWLPTKLCPDMHFGLIFFIGYPHQDMFHINYQMLDNGGSEIPIPEEHIKLREDILSDQKAF